MDAADKNRLARAWVKSHDWITKFDGSPTLALLVSAPAPALQPALETIAARSENFRITAVPADQPASPRFIPLEAFPAHLALLQEGKLAEMSVNYAHRSEAFDLDIHLVIFPLKHDRVSVELVWWNDQVFSVETDYLDQFNALLTYFIELQRLFAAESLFLSPERGGDPSQSEDSWIEI